MKTKKKQPKKWAPLVRRMSSKELCVSLVAIAAFHVEDKQAQIKIYEAVRRLELMEAAAISAGLLPGAR